MDNKRLLKSYKKKQKLYTKYLKNKTFANEQKYKTYKNIFEKVKIKSKMNTPKQCKRNVENNERNNRKNQKYE